ncbi:hypothetical protein HJFPF1_04688 [Paramyrothecium foliicola]|nr:hypothetical protein HJFPF1_04688 [Paramyrothecium foliicola]
MALQSQSTAKMKFTVSFLALLSGVAALPAESSIAPRQASVTDNLLFGITLPAFTARRNARNPPNLDWTSDGCTSSPDNPLNFPFVPACHRHDFGYHNYRAQSRFTVSNKKRIDDNFLADLRFQCQSTSVVGVCNALAQVYYAAVRAFGGDDAIPGKRDDELVQQYEDAVLEYERLVQEAREAGQIE